ncbi:MAG: tetratricopeptide repeat protein, partial [Bryobacteraceae bacterium]
GANLFAGVSEADLGQPQEALQYLKRARELDQSNPAPDLALGKAYAALRDFRNANQAYAEAAKLGPGIAEAWYGLGITYRSLAEERLRRAAEGESINTVETHRLLDESLRALQRAVALDPKSAQAHLILGESLRDSGKLVDAVPEYQAAIRLAPRMEAAYLGLATSYWKIGQWDDVMPPLRHALDLAPRDPEANTILADMLLRQNDYQNAEKHAEIALAGNPKLFRARVVLARIDLARKQPGQAAAELEKVANADPDGSYHFLLWRAYKLAGKPEQAEAALKEYKRRRAATNKPTPSQ